MNGEDRFYDDVAEVIREMFPDALLVPNLGTNTSVLMRNGERDNEFYMWGGMGLVHSIALGLAMTRPQRTVITLDGDGALLMGLAGLATIGSIQPSNLLHIVLDNQAWGNTGGQTTHTARGIDLATVAKGCAYEVSESVDGLDELRQALVRYQQNPCLTMIHVPMPYVDITRPPIDPDPVGIKERFMRSAQN